MAWTQADIDALRASITQGGGVVTIQFSNRSVTFASLKERRDLLAEMERVVNAGTAPGYRLAAHNKGL